jgi:cysteinyl-tRNA synthetase
MAVTGMYVLQGVVPSEVASAPFDVKVVETYNDNGVAFSKSDVAKMTAGAGDVLGYFCLGEAENYRSYFKSLPKSVLGPVDPDWAGNYQVAYWSTEWKSVAKAEIARMVQAGYDGVYFDVIDEYEMAWAKKNAPGGDAAGAMKSLVKELSAYAKSLDPDFKVWVNGGEGLLTDASYVKAVDGLFKENLFYDFDGSNKIAAADTQYSLDLLKYATNAGKPVVAIEYVAGNATKVADVHAKAAKAGIGSYVAELELDGINLADNPVTTSGGSTGSSTGTGTGGTVTTNPGSTDSGSDSGSTDAGSGSGTGTGGSGTRRNSGSGSTSFGRRNGTSATDSDSGTSSGSGSSTRRTSLGSSRSSPSVTSSGGSTRTSSSGTSSRLLGTPTTLGYSSDATSSDTTSAASAGTGRSRLALLNQYAASSFDTAGAFQSRTASQDRASESLIQITQSQHS